ncbi:MAG: glutathione peroxidase [Deltaproteobacteria bacterium]|nr:glutathione peroxidase [Deltaproteobacteria bacterium]
MPNLHDFTMTTIDGAEQSLAAYNGKVVLVVNVASKCGLTPQYEGLQRLYDTYQQRGFEVLGIPCNQFMEQEPGTEAEIKDFCTTNFDVSFPMFSKLDVNGDGRHPLYAWLTGEDTKPEGPGDVKWNFGKFLVGKDGALLARFEPGTEPQAADLKEALEAALS